MNVCSAQVDALAARVPKSCGAALNIAAPAADKYRSVPAPLTCMTHDKCHVSALHTMPARKLCHCPPLSRFQSSRSKTPRRRSACSSHLQLRPATEHILHGVITYCASSSCASSPSLLSSAPSTPSASAIPLPLPLPQPRATPPPELVYILHRTAS